MNQLRSHNITMISLAVAVGLVAILGLQNRSLKSMYSTLVEEISGPYEGLSVPAFDAVTLTGDSVTIGTSPDGERQVLFFFAAACPTSRRTIPTWNSIASAARKNPGFNTYGIQLDAADMKFDYPDVDVVRFPVLRLPDPRLREWYRVGGVPTTVVLDAAGRVVYKRLGGIATESTIDSVLTAARDSGQTFDLLTTTAGQP